MNRLRDKYSQAEADPVGGDQAGDDEAATVLDRVQLAEGLADLPAREREVLVLFYLQDLALEECADVRTFAASTRRLPGGRLGRLRRSRDHRSVVGHRARHVADADAARLRRADHHWSGVGGLRDLGAGTWPRNFVAEHGSGWIAWPYTGKEVVQSWIAIGLVRWLSASRCPRRLMIVEAV